MSASFRKAELMRMGKGYFWKSLGNNTTASHCSPSFPDRSPEIKHTFSTSRQPVIFSWGLVRLIKHKTEAKTQSMRRYATPLALLATFIQLHESGVSVQFLLAVASFREERTSRWKRHFCFLRKTDKAARFITKKVPLASHCPERQPCQLDHIRSEVWLFKIRCWNV